jgi:hypothetical protein
LFDKVFGSINEFFAPNYVDTTPVPKQESAPEELSEKVKNVLLESGMLEVVKNYKKSPLINAIPPLFKLFGGLVNEEEFLQHNLRNLQFLAENEDYLVKKKPFLDFNLYSSIYPTFKSLLEKFPEYLGIYSNYLEYIEDKINANEIISSLNFINEERDKVGDYFINKPMSELLELRDWMFFEKLKKSNEGQFRMYFNDWTLKQSQIIEYTIKAIFKLFLQLDLAVNGANESDTAKGIKVMNTIGKMIQYFDPKNQKQNLTRLRIYRNAVFHPGTEFIYNRKENLKKLIFEDDYGKFEVTVEEFINDFKKLMIFISTINYIVAFILFKSEHNGKNIFQVNYDYAKEHGLKRFLVWVLTERSKNKYIKYFLL